MKFIKKTAIFAFLLFTFVLNAFAQTETVAARTWEVQRYDITATLPQGETDRNLTVKAVLNLKNVSSAAASRLTLRISEKAEIADVKVGGAAGSFTKSLEKIGSTLNLQRAAISVPSVSPGQTVSVEVNYKLKVDENSGLNSLSPAGAQFLPLSFWYPTPNSWYYARGADYAPFNIKVNLAAGQKILSSGSQSAEGSSENGTSFEQKLYGQPFFLAGSWDTVETPEQSDKKKAVYDFAFLPKGAGEKEKQIAIELLKLADEAKAFAATFLNNGTGFSAPLKIVAVKRGAGFSGGGTILLDENVFRRKKIDSTTVVTLAEAIARNWIDGAAQLDGEGFGAVREGLPRFIATQFLEQKYGREVADIERLRQRMAYSAVAKRDARCRRILYNKCRRRKYRLFETDFEEAAARFRCGKRALPGKNLFRQSMDGQRRRAEIDEVCI